MFVIDVITGALSRPFGRSGAAYTLSGALDTQGNFVPLDSLPQVINRDGSGNVSTIVATGTGNTWTQTYTYTNGAVSAISGWVKA